MDDRATETSKSAADPARRVADTAQEVASRAGAYVQRGMRTASEQAQGLAEDASDRVMRLTGRPLESWTSELRRFVEEHPLQALAITVGIGFVLGKILDRD